MPSRPFKLRVMWKGGVFLPENRMIRSCEREFGEGEIITFERNEDRDMNSHRHYFASIKMVWDNLPEEKISDFPTPEHLRKKLLILAGWADEKTLVCDSAQEAAVVAAFIAPIDDFSIVTVKGNVVVRYSAKSQSVAAMGRDVFQQSKWAVLNLAADLIGVSSSELNKNAEIETKPRRLLT